MNQIPKKKLLYGAIYGTVAGLVFSLLAWGYNAAILATHHFATPWFTFTVGVLVVTVITALTGYYAVRSNSTLTSSILWVIAGIFSGALAIVLPLYLFPNYVNFTNPNLNGWLEFGWNESYSLILFFAIFYSAISFLIIGLLENSLVESAYYSLSAGQLMIALLICSIFAGLIGGIVDSFANTNIRKSVVALDEIITYVTEHEGQVIAKETTRALHLSALNTVKENLTDQRKLYLFSVNETFDQTKILLETNGVFAICYVFLDQPSNCTISTPGE